ncbi:hypothetical protein [Streptomyces sp. NPDC002889]|uniref:hypothetical protein n=1 Tax=Streptomyces sp. NPDC002889 TaxID=3364669 RepID=UPI0036B6C48C
MVTSRLLAATALALVSIGLGAQAAYPGDAGTLEVSPSPASPGTKVTVSTTACGKDGHGTGDASSVGAGEFRLRADAHEEGAVGRFTIPDDTEPGTYDIEVRCKKGKRAEGELVVRHHGRPSGHVSTGVGGSVGPDTTQIAAGVAVLAAAAVGGTLLLRRRASGAQDS